MDDRQKTEVEYIVAIQKGSDASQDEPIAILADVLVEGFMSQLETKTEEPTEVYAKKGVKNSPKEFYY